MMTNRNRFLTICFAVLLAPIPAMAQRLHPKLKEAKPAPINRVVILPAQMSMVKDGMKGGEPMEKEAAAAIPIIEGALAKALAAKQLSVLDSPFKPEALAGDEKLKYAVADLQRNYDELLAKISRKSKDVEKGRFSLGDQVLLLNQDDNIDAFVFIRGFGQKKTGGKKAFAALTLNPLGFMPIYFLTITIADARNGDVLAYGNIITTSDITQNDDKKLVDALIKRLKKLPAGEAKGTVAEKK